MKAPSLSQNASTKNSDFNPARPSKHADHVAICAGVFGVGRRERAYNTLYPRGRVEVASLMNQSIDRQAPIGRIVLAISNLWRARQFTRSIPQADINGYRVTTMAGRMR
jgi:hypothetical protein